MKKQVLAAIIWTFSTLALTGCGGGGSAPPAAVKATTKVFLFGAMSSNSRIATVQTTMTVPSGVMVNYSSPPGAVSGTFPLRGGFAVPSGPVKVSATDISGTFDTASRQLTVSLINRGRLDLASNTTGNGAEIAALNFTLAAPDTKPGMPAQDPLASVGQERATQPAPSVDYLTGCKINFVTTQQ